MTGRTLRVLTWNLFHGRSVPGAGRSLREEFAAALAGWEWDVALLQEVPPWWAELLARRCAAVQRSALTSRNWLPPLQSRLAERFPDLLKSGGGGANTLLVRGRVLDHRRLRVRWWPERRVVHAVRLADGVWVANLHATAHGSERAHGDVERARAAALGWAAAGPLVFGGDLNVRRPQVPGLAHVGSSHVDHLYARGLVGVDAAEVLQAGRLSDHHPLAATLRLEP
jgi:endonuclease/exonuclease/phosphatase family metal-dependent hydrolase